MIAIINTGETTAEGQAHYRVQINHKVICTFDHTRTDGLATCLRLAADAVELEQAKGYLKREQLLERILKEVREP